MAAPFVPGYIQANLLPQSNLVQQQYLQSQMLYQNPYQALPIPPQRTYHGPVPSKSAPKRANTSWIKKTNLDRAYEKDRMYQEWMFAQHQRVSPSSITHKPSPVLPEGDYIGYYFNTEMITATCAERIPESPSKQGSTMEYTDDEGAVKEIVISANDGMEYRFAHEGPKGILPLLPLVGPVFCQAKLEPDCSPLGNTTIAKIGKPTSRFLPLFEPAKGLVSEYASIKPTAASLGGEAGNGSIKADVAAPSSMGEDVHDAAKYTRNHQTEAQYYGYAIVRQETVGNLQARDTIT